MIYELFAPPPPRRPSGRLVAMIQLVRHQHVTSSEFDVERTLLLGCTCEAVSAKGIVLE